jgi:hypothetical protein
VLITVEFFSLVQWCEVLLEDIITVRGCRCEEVKSDKIRTIVLINFNVTVRSMNCKSIN